MCCHPRLYKAAESGNKEVVLKCITDGDDINCRIEGLLSTPLLTATYEGHIDVVYILVQQHCDVDAKDTVGRTALNWFSLRGNIPVVSFLIKHGANIHNRDQEGETPLLAAVRSGRLDTVMLLIQSGANVEDRDNMGQTALMCAATEGRMSVFQMLLDHGAKWDIRDDMGNTILERQHLNIDHHAVVHLTYMSMMHKCVRLLNVQVTKGSAKPSPCGYSGKGLQLCISDLNVITKTHDAGALLQYDAGKLQVGNNIADATQLFTLKHVTSDENLVHKTHGPDNFNITPIPDGLDSPQMTLTLSDLSKIKFLMKYICQIDYPSGLATGFVYDFIDVDLTNRKTCVVMVSQHILADHNLRNGTVQKGLRSGISESCAVFNHHGSQGKSVPAQYNIKGVYMENAELDYALVYLEYNQLLASSFDNSGLCKYIPVKNVVGNERLTLIGHSMGGVMQADTLKTYHKSNVIKLVQDKQSVNRPLNDIDKSINPGINWTVGHNLHYLHPHCPEFYLFYTCHSYHGSSGAPCFQFTDEDQTDFRLMCVQKAGIYAATRNPKPGEQCDFAVGVLATLIKRDIDNKIRELKCKN